MKAIEVLERIREVFNEINKPVQPVAMLDAKLQDGTMVQVTELAVGGIVTIDGVPAPAGEHTLEDGTVIVVGDNGAITEIKPKAEIEIEIEAPEMDMSSKFAAFENMTSQKFSSYEAKFSAYEQRFAEYETKLSKYMQAMETLMNLTQTLASAPTGQPDAAVKPQQFSEVKKSYDILFSKK
jgi:hypothetical protein